MNHNHWAVTLLYKNNEKLEDRVSLIVEYLAQHYRTAAWLISDIDATGNMGGDLTLQINKLGESKLTSQQFLSVLQEDGQVIELTAVFLYQNEKGLFQIIVRDGSSIDVLGIGEELPIAVLKEYIKIDTNLFN